MKKDNSIASSYDISSTRIASFTTRGSAVNTPSTSVQNSTRFTPKEAPIIAAEKSEPLRPNNPIDSFLVTEFVHVQMKPENKRILV